MKIGNLIFAGFLLLLLGGVTGCQSENASEQDEAVVETVIQPQRIISLSGFLTEVLYELGHGEMLVARDVTTTYPAVATDLPNLGHVSQLNAEAVLALSPDLVFVEEAQLKQSKVFPQLEAANLELVVVPTHSYLNNSVQAAQIISEALGGPRQAVTDLQEKITADSTQLANQLDQYTATPRVLFIYARGAGRLMVGGTNTSVSAMIEKAGGTNAVQSFEGYQALTPEALIEAQPEVILMFSSGLASLDGKQGLAQITGIPQTVAYQNDRIVTMDGHYLSSFGPRAGQAALELAVALQEK